MIFKLKTITLLVIVVVVLTLAILLSMHPFLKYPFDMYHHLLWIEDNYSSDTLPNSPKYYWHYLWGNIFNFFNIDNSKIFVRAYIIYYTQTIIAYLSVYYFSYTTAKYIFYKSINIVWHTIAVWATFIWFIIYATGSMGFHLVWIQWYSVTYQISLPLMLLATASLFNFIYDNKKRYFYLFLALFFIFLVLLIHGLEFIYFLMYIASLIVIYIDKITIYLKKNKWLSITLFIMVALIVYYLDKIIPLISYRMPKLLKFIFANNFNGLWDYILQSGAYVVGLLNRKYSVFNELMVVSLYLATIVLAISIYLYKKYKNLNIRLIIFLVISSFFVLIPLYQISAGIASALTYKTIVHRFYYSSTIFLAIPIFSYLVLYIMKKEKNTLLMSLIVSFVLLATFYYSRFAISTPQAFYKNIQSIKNAWNERKVGFNLSRDEIKQVGDILKDYEAKYGKKIIYFAREDIAFVIKYIYTRKVFLPIEWRGNSLKKDFYIKAYNHKKTELKKVLFKTPKGFPKYEPYK